MSLLLLDNQQDCLSSVSGAVGYAMGFDAHSGGQIFTNGLSTQCPLYGTMVSINSIAEVVNRMVSFNCMHRITEWYVIVFAPRQNGKS